MSSTSGARLVAYVVRGQRRPFAVMVGLLALAGLLEGIGIAAFLPVAQGIDRAAPVPAGPGAAATGLLEALGLPVSLGMLLAAVVVVFAIKAVVLYRAGLQVGRIVARVEVDLFMRLLRGVARADWRHVATYPSGFIANAVSSETGRTGTAIYALAQAFAGAIVVTVYVALALLVSWPVAVSAIAAGAIVLFALRGRITASRAAAHDQVRILRAIMARITDALPSFKPLRAMGREAYLLSRLDAHAEAFLEARYRGIASAEALTRAREPLLVGMVAFGLWLVVSLAVLDIGTTLVLALLFLRTVTSITAVQQKWVLVAVGEASFRSLMEHIATAERVEEAVPTSSHAAAPSCTRDLRLENVSFSYWMRPVLSGVSARLRAGRLVVVTGPSGAGKTTLLDLVTGLLRPTEGRIVVDGEDLHALDVRTWRRSIGYVPQEPMLFGDTVRANVALGDASIDDARIEWALRAANAWDFVCGLPDRLGQYVGEGGHALSGGERQRLAIARALVGGPTLLVLDEPTSGLDRAAEAQICAELASWKGHLTMLVASHQPALQAIADELWHVEHGGLRVQRPE